MAKENRAQNTHPQAEHNMIFDLRVRNVNHALPVAVSMFKSESDEHVREVTARGTRTLEWCDIWATTYLDPTERVLFHPKRDANPFFHLFESLWILAGQADVATLEYFLPRIREYSDNGTLFHGAYGHRADYCQQTWNAIQELRRDPYSRRAVIALWTPERDSGYTGKDMPCNTTLYFKIRDGLNLTVCNRSNDMVWGAYGANVVQFSMLQEYIAAMLNVPVGRYTQLSDSFHVYPDRPDWERLKNIPLFVNDPYELGYCQPMKLVDNPETFEMDVDELLCRMSTAIHEDKELPWDKHCSNNFLNFTAVPMFNVLRAHRHKQTYGAHHMTNSICATDWRYAVREWLERRT